MAKIKDVAKMTKTSKNAKPRQVKKQNSNAVKQQAPKVQSVEVKPIRQNPTMGTGGVVQNSIGTPSAQSSPREPKMFKGVKNPKPETVGRQPIFKKPNKNPHSASSSTTSKPSGNDNSMSNKYYDLKAQVKQASNAKAKKVAQVNEGAYGNLGRMDAKGMNGGLAGGREVFSTGKDNFLDWYGDAEKGAGRLKKAGVGIAQASAVSAAGHAGVAYLSGDDPWEAAKTGALRGAIGGAGYQTLKGATKADTGSMWGNMSHIGRANKEIYKATTIKGREAYRQQEMSNSLATLMNTRASAMVNRAQTTEKVGNRYTQQMKG